MEKHEEEPLLGDEEILAGGTPRRKSECTGEEQEEESKEENTNEEVAVAQGNESESQPFNIPTSASFAGFSNEHTPLIRPSPSFVG